MEGFLQTWDAAQQTVAAPLAQLTTEQRTTAGWGLLVAALLAASWYFGSKLHRALFARKEARDRNPRVLIVGCGAVGAVVGFHVCRGGIHVGFLAKPAQVPKLHSIQMKRLGLCTCQRGEDAVQRQVEWMGLHVYSTAAEVRHPPKLADGIAAAGRQRVCELPDGVAGGGGRTASGAWAEASGRAPAGSRLGCGHPRTPSDHAAGHAAAAVLAGQTVASLLAFGASESAVCRNSELGKLLAEGSGLRPDAAVVRVVAELTEDAFFEDELLAGSDSALLLL
jgi:hypothetical protein